MLQTLAKPLSLQEFLALPETEPAREFIDGKILQKPMPQGQHSRLQQKLITAINNITEEAQTALALPELRCSFGNRSIVPDIAVFAWDRVPTEPNGTIANQFSAPPDWIIEILSPDQSMTRVTRNILHCLDHGSQMGWLIDPQEQVVLVHQTAPNPTPLIQTAPQDLLQERPDPSTPQARSQRIQTQLLENSTDRLPVPTLCSDFTLTLGQLFNWLKLKIN